MYYEHVYSLVIRKRIIFMVLIIITVAIIWMRVLMFLLGFVLCIFYSRFMKKKDLIRLAGIDYTENGEYLQSNEPRKSKIYLSCLHPYLYGLCRYYSIVIGRIPSHHVRKFLLKLIFAMQIDNKAVIYGGFELRSPWNIQIGNSVIGAGALLDGRSGIVIHNNVTLAQNVCIFTLQHDVNDEHFGTNGKGGKVEVDDYVWLSSRTTILPGVHVGTGAVLASGGIATKNLEEYFIYAGIPAKKISERNRKLNYQNTKSYWHFY